MSALALRLSLAGAFVAALVDVWLYMGHLKREAVQARSEAVAAQTQTKVEQAAVPVVEKFHETQVRIITQAERSAADVQRLPTADTALDPGFVSGLRGMLDPEPVVANPDRPGEP